MYDMEVCCWLLKFDLCAWRSEPPALLTHGRGADVKWKEGGGERVSGGARGDKLCIRQRRIPLGAKRGQCVLMFALVDDKKPRPKLVGVVFRLRNSQALEDYSDLASQL